MTSHAGRAARASWCAVAIAAIAIGCSGDEERKETPRVGTGADVTVVAGDAAALAATLTGFGSTSPAYAWSLVERPLGSAAQLAADAPLATSLQTDVEGRYVARLTATEGAQSLSDDVIVTASPRYAGGEVTGTAPAAGAELTAMAARVEQVLALYAAKSASYNTVNADAVARQLSGKATQPASALFVLDVRSAEDFAAGHVPGAVNVPLAHLPAVLLGNPGFIPDAEVAVASYNGGDGNMASLLLNVARIADPVAQKAAELAGTAVPYKRSRAIFGGMMAWTFSRELSPARFDDDLGVRRIEDGALETTPNAGADQGALPAYAAFNPASDTAVRRILVRARDYLAGLEAGGAYWTDFVEVRDLRADADASNDPFVLSVRGAPDYAKGHVPGAVNIPYTAVADLTKAKVLPTDRTIAVYCYTGHTGGVATMALGILGYRTRNVLYGMNGWTLSSACASGQLRNFDLQKTWDLPLHDAVSSLDGYAPPRAGCLACHASLHALQYEFGFVEPPAATTESVGEG